MTNRSRAKLIHLLIATSIVEGLLATVVAVAFFLATTNENLQGVLDEANSETVSGWAVDQSKPYARVELQLYIDDAFVADGLAAEPRPDVHAAERAEDDWHGFVFRTPPLKAGEHEARVYAVNPNRGGTRRTLQLVGKPLRFSISAQSASSNSGGESR